MIAIFECAIKIKQFLEEKGETKFKIFVRLQMQLDVYIFSERVEDAKCYYDEFVEYMQKLDGVKHDNYKISFDVVSPEELDDPYYASVAADLERKIDYGPRYSQNSLLSLPEKMDLDKDLPPVVTFYSYKGGMGRTTTLMSYAMDLAYNHKKNVAIVDCDLEAPGYLNFFSLYNHKELKNAQKNGFVEFVCDSKFYDDDVDVSDYLVEVEQDPQIGNGKIWVVPAGNLNEGCLDKNVYKENVSWNHRNDYLEGLGKLNSIDLVSLKNAFLKLFRKLKDSKKPDVILVDSRTGFNDVFGTLAFNLSTCVVGFFGRSRQTEPGFIDLLTKHLLMQKSFDLQLVYSILPPGESGGSSRMMDLMSHLYPSNPPSQNDLHRNDLLERIGSDDENADEEYQNEIRSLSSSEKLEDYRSIFDSINSAVFKNEVRLETATASDSRLVILRHLKKVLDVVDDCAEFSEIESSRFFFRNCMKDLFRPEKFIIQGYKGTGKTCLYRALANRDISNKMREWAQDDSRSERIFLQILPEKEAEYPFKSVDFSNIQDTEFYFRSLWKFVTWNNLLLDDGNPDLKNIREAVQRDSALKDFIRPISGAQTSALFHEIIKRENALSFIEQDLNRFDEETGRENKSLFILYDRLDSFVPALRWNKIVSPLIEFWRDFHSNYKNIIPKIFIRTDLFKQTEGVNTARLTNNIINIEWNIAEVFAYFFKLIFSDNHVGQLFWNFSIQLGIDGQYIESIKKNFDKNFNQFKSLNEAEMVPVVQAFFGKEVLFKGVSYGKPWIYFGNELANADRNSISLRPFVNLLKESIEQANLKFSIKECTEILSSEIYASDDVRFKAADMYFGDIVRDQTAVDLEKLKEVVEGNPKYRYKSLHESLFRELITDVYERIQSKGVDRVVENQEKLKALIFANGIMAKKDTSRGIFYAYAPIYCFAWRLRDSFAESEKTDGQGRFSSKSAIKDRLVGVLKVNQYQQPYVSVTIGQGNEQREFRYEVREKMPVDCEIGDLVSFKINEIPHRSKVNGVYRIAVGIRRISQDVLNTKAYSTSVVLNEWAVSNNVKAKDAAELLRQIGINIQNPSEKVDLRDIAKIKGKLLKPVVINEWSVAHRFRAKDVVEILRANGVDVQNSLSKAYPDDLKMVEDALNPEKKSTQKMRTILKSNEQTSTSAKEISEKNIVVPKLYDISDQDLPSTSDDPFHEGFWSRIWSAIKRFFTREL